MPYSIIKVVNGSYEIYAECDSLKQARVNFHTLCAALWNDKAPLVARVQIIDQSLQSIDTEEIILSAAPAEA
jgi:hypothetical protein